MIFIPPPALSLARLISPERILTDLHGGSRRQVLRDLGSLAARQLGIEASVILGALSRHPAMPSFGPARGVAMPHACVAGVESPAAFLARLARPIPFEAADSELVGLVMLVLAPAGDPSTLLRAMACAARQLRDRSVREAILSAGSADAIFSILAGEDWRVPHGKAAGRGLALGA